MREPRLLRSRRVRPLWALLSLGTCLGGASASAAPAWVTPEAPASAEPKATRAAPLPVPAHLEPALADQPKQPLAAGVAQTNVFFLNYDGVSIKYTGQLDNSAQDVSMFQEFQGNYQPYGAGNKRAASLQAVKADWAKYDVVITDVRPQGVYTMCVNSPTNPFGGGVLGIAPLDCNDGIGPNIVFAYHSANDQFSAATQATTMSQEIAHAYGVEHVSQPNDIMNPFNAGGDPSFLDQCLNLDDSNGQAPIQCNQQHQMFCPNGQQSSHQELLWLFGSAAADTSPPTVSITSPTNGQVFEPGASFTVLAEASDDAGVVEVRMYVNGDLVENETQPPYDVAVNGIPAGSYSFDAEAEDLSGNVTKAATVMIQVVEPVEPPPVTTDPTGEPVGTDSDGDGGTGESGDLPTTDPGPISGAEDSGSDEGGGDVDGSVWDPALPPGYGQNGGDEGCDAGGGQRSQGLALLLVVGLAGLGRRRR